MAIDAQKLTEKDELIAQFYTLRAGLSAIAEENQPIKETEKQIEIYRQKNKKNLWEIEQKYRKENSEISEIKWDKESKIKELKSSIEYSNNSIRSNKAKRSELQATKGYKKFRKKPHYGLCTVITLGIMFVILAILDIVSGMEFSEVLVYFFFISPFVTCFIYKRIADNKAKEKCNQEILNLTKEIQAFENAIEVHEDDIKRLQKEISSLKNSYEDQLDLNIYENDIKSLQENLKYDIIPTQTARVKSIKNALNKQFDKIITESDWENVDLLIFYLNTGRADSLKEALLLVDRQRQNDNIVNAIHSASEHISSTIHENTFKLARAMSNCFGRLSSQIAENHREIMAGMSITNQAINNLSDNIGNLGSHLNDLSGQIQGQLQTQTNAIMDVKVLNDSLLRQSNLNSKALVDELRYNQRYWYK